MAVNEFEDKIPKNFIIRVYETKLLAEKGLDKDALYVFDNGIDNESGTSADPRISNGSQFISGTNGSAVTNKVTDANATFSDRLVGKTLTNLVTGDTAVIDTVDSETVLGLESDICSSGSEAYHINSPGHYFTFEKYYYRIDSSETVKGFIIDWDDGTDNSSEKANRQTILLDIPNNYTIVEHTYTKHGKFYPMVRTISIDGYYSKWYTSYDKRYDSENLSSHGDIYTWEHYPSDGLYSLDKQIIPAGQNSFSEVSLDLAQAQGAKVRIPEFVPANYPPVANLQVDRASVFSGIDNSSLSYNSGKGPDAIGYAYVPRDGHTLSDFTNSIEVIFKTTKGNIIKETINCSSAAAAGGSRFPKNNSNGYLSELLSVKLIKLKEGDINSTDLLGPDERVHILWYTPPTKAFVESDDVLTTVSLGNPIQTLDRPGFSSILDGSQSQTKCSNVDINKYIFDDGKLPLSSTNTDTFVKSTKESISDVITGSKNIGHPYDLSSSDFDQENSKLRVFYNFKPNKGHIIDNLTKRFYDEERLVRLQVEDNSNKTFADDKTEYYDSTDKRDTTKNTSSTRTIDDTTTSIFITTTWVPTELYPGNVMQIEDEQMLITSINYYWKMFKVERAFNGTTAVSHGTNKDVYHIPKYGRTADSARWSFLEHWNSTAYYDDVNRPSALKSRGLLLYANSSSADGANILGEEVWTQRDYQNQYNKIDAFTDDTDAGGNDALVFGGLGKSTYSASGAPNYTQLTHSYTNGHKKRPSNWLLITKTDRFNKIHIRLDNDFTGIAAGSVSYSDDVFNDVKINLHAWYAWRDPLNYDMINHVQWKPLSFVDGTSTGGDGESLRCSGTLYFDIPEDWVKTASSKFRSSEWSGGWDGTDGVPVPDEDVTGMNEDPSSLWVDEMYGILIGISVDGSPDANGEAASWAQNIQCPFIQTYNNSHSQAITIKDPHHKSLNDITIAQSVSWSRSGKIMNLEDRFGRSELRKIGASGGNITFGGVELGGTDYTITKAAILRYQREATPVYLDIARRNGDYIRFYGVITSLSEDNPTGMSLPKWGVTMAVGHVAEFDSTGAWISEGLMSLGGEVIDEPKYLL
jgi:hypothetical protein